MTRTQILEYITSIEGWLSSHEGFFLYEMAKKVPAEKRPHPNPLLKGEGEQGDVSIVEIGSWMGKSTICLAAGLKSGSGGIVYAIDPHKGEYTKNNGIGKKAPTYQKFIGNLKKAGVLDVVVQIIATSEKAAGKWKKPIDFLFIDGLHDYKNTNLDFSLWSPLLKNRGVVAFHDAFCGHSGPEKVILEKVLSHNTWSNIGVVGSIIYAQKRKATLLQQLNLFRHRILIPLALKLDKSNISPRVKFFLIHRVIKLLLVNIYTWQLQFEK